MKYTYIKLKLCIMWTTKEAMLVYEATQIVSDLVEIDRIRQKKNLMKTINYNKKLKSRKTKASKYSLK